MRGSREEGPWILVLDVGSSSAKAWLYARGGAGLDPGPDSRRVYSWKVGADGKMEIGAEDLLGHAAEALDGALLTARAAGLEIAAVATTTFWHGLLGLDEAGEPLTPLYGWGDSRAAGAALRLAELADAEALHQRTGCFLHASYPLVKLTWLRGRDRSAFAAVARWGSFAEYMERCLFGDARTSYSMASGTGLLDVHRLGWDDEALGLSGIGADRLFPLVDAGAPQSGLRPEYATRWPELAAVPWFPALGDGACANVGSGAAAPGRLAVTVGTSAAVRQLGEQPAGRLEIPARLWCYRLDGRRIVMGGALSNGGNGIAALRRMLRLPDEREWELELADLAPDAHGLTMLPFLLAERGAGWREETRGAIFGLTQRTPPVHLLRGWMEAVAYRVARVAEELRGALGEPASAHASGGALHASPVWVQILADTMGLTVALSAEREETARGAALVAAERLGWVDDLADAPAPQAARYEADAERHRVYGAAMRRQQDLLAALRPFLNDAAPAGPDPDFDD